MIHITDHKTDEIIAFIDEEFFWNDNHKKSLKDTLETFDFTTFADKDFSEHLTKKNRIIIPDEDGEMIEFEITNTRKYRSKYALKTDIYSSASYLALKRAKVIRPHVTNALSAEAHARAALAGTEVEVGTVAFNGIRTFTFEEHTNPYKYLKRIASEFDLELHFRVGSNGHKIVRRYADLLERVGRWRGRESEFGKDLEGIERKEDFSKIVTALVGLGPVREDGTRLEVFVENKDALTRWGRNGQHIIEPYEPQSTDQNMTEERLRTLTENELEKRINSSIEYKADIVDLENAMGLDHEIMRFGDTTKIKDTKFNPPLYLEARIHTQERPIKRKHKGKKTVTLGDFIEYTEAEVMAIWKSLQEQIRRKIGMSELEEVTYTKPQIDGKDDAVREEASKDAQAKTVEGYLNTVNAEKESVDKRYLAIYSSPYLNGTAKSELQNAKIDYNTKYTALVDEINRATADGETTPTEKESVDVAFHNYRDSMGAFFDKFEIANDYITQAKADEAESKANNHTDQMKQQFDQELLDKADLTYVNGQLNLKADSDTVQQIEGTVSSLQTTTDNLLNDVANHSNQLQEQGGKITTVETDLDKVEGQLSVALTNLSTLEGKVSSQGTQISANTEAISLKASQTEVDGLQEQFENLQIGARNLLIGTKKKVDDFPNKVTYDGTVYSYYGYAWQFSFTVNLKADKTYTVSVPVYNPSTETSVARIRVGDATGNVRFNVGAGVAKTISHTFTVNQTQEGAIVRFLTHADTYPVLAWWYPKLEQGNKATDWTPAPEDIEADITAVGTRVTSLSSEVNVLAGKVELKAEKSALESLENNVTSVQNQVGQLEVSYNGISAEVSNLETTVNGHSTDLTNMSASMGIMQDQISTKVSMTEVEGAISNISIGGRNYARGTHKEYRNYDMNNKWRIQVSRNSMSELGLKTGDEITYSAYINPVNGYGGAVRIDYYDSNNNYTSKVGNEITSETGKGLSQVTGIIPSGYSIIRLTIQNEEAGTDLTYVFQLKQVKLEKGNKATDWTPAPEDVQSNIDSVYSYAESEITQLSNEIQLKVSEAEFDNLSGRVNSAESTINQHSNQIALKVDVDGVIGAINLSSESAVINASKINLVGAVTVLSDITGNLGTINAGTINGVTINGSTINSIVDSKNKTTISNNRIYSEGEFWKTGFGSGNGSVNGYGIFEVDDGELIIRSGQITSTGSRRPWQGIELGANGVIVTSENKGDGSNDMYLSIGGIGWGGAWDSSPTSLYSQYSSFNGATAGNNLNIVADGRVIIDNLSTNRGYFEIGSYSASSYGSGMMQSYYKANDREWYIYGKTSNYTTIGITVRADNFSTSSTVDKKENIEAWENNVLDKYRNELFLYQYNMIGDESKTLKHGIVIGEGYKPWMDIVSSNGLGVDNYEFMTHNAKAIQELIGRTDDHADDINFLKMENQYLKGKVKELEAKIA